MKLHELREQRSQKASEMRAIVDTAEREKRDLSDGENQRFDTLKGEARALDTKISRGETLDEIERHAEARSVQGDEFGRELRNISVSRALAVAMGRENGGREQEVSDEVARRSGKAAQGIFIPPEAVFPELRALTSTTPAAGPGSNLVPTTHRGDLMIDRQRPALKTQMLGAMVLNGLTGNIDIPKLTGSSTAHWVSEHEDTTRSDPKFGSVGMGPRTVSGEVEYSRRMVLQASPAVDQIITNDLRNVLATEVDRAAINGDGVKAPLGLLNMVGLGSVTHAGDFSDTAADLIAELDTANVDAMRGFLTNAEVMKAMRKVKDADGHIIPVFDLLHGEPIEWSNNVPSDLGAGNDKSPLIYGDWSDLIIAYWSGIDLLPNPYHADVASKGGMLLHAFLDCDIAVRHIESFASAEI